MAGWTLVYMVAYLMARVANQTDGNMDLSDELLDRNSPMCY